jgi:hypothetical protein
MPETSTLTSTFNAKPSGLSGLYQLTKRLGLRCRQWQLPYRRLPELAGTLVIIGPSESLQEFEIEQILSWVASGNKLIYLDSFSYSYGRHILAKLGLDAHESPGVADVRVEPTGNRAEFQFVPWLIVSAETRLDGGQPLVSDHEGTVLTRLEHGKGQVLIGVTPSLCSNRRLGERNDWPNFQFLANELATTSGEVIFDEFCHGYTQATNLFIYLGRSPAGPLFAQALLILLIASVGGFQRFGGVRNVNQARKISTSEFINGLSNTFRRAHAADLVVAVLSHSLKAKLCKALGVSPHEEASKLVAAWAAATGCRAEELSQFLSDSQAAMEIKRLPEDRLIALVGACDKISEQSKDLFATRIGKFS